MWQSMVFTLPKRVGRVRPVTLQASAMSKRAQSALGTQQHTRYSIPACMVCCVCQVGTHSNRHTHALRTSGTGATYSLINTRNTNSRSSLEWRDHRSCGRVRRNQGHKQTGVRNTNKQQGATEVAQPQALGGRGRAVCAVGMHMHACRLLVCALCVQEGGRGGVRACSGMLFTPRCASRCRAACPHTYACTRPCTRDQHMQQCSAPPRHQF